MKIFTLSDLHVDVRPFTETFEGHNDDIVIIPGDICPINHYRFESTIRNICNNVKYLLFVPGNHEYYNCDIVKDSNILCKLEEKISNFIILNNKTITLNNIKFIGSTMWTDMNKRNPLSMHACKYHMNDFWIIKNNNKTFTPESSVDLHEEAITFIEEEILNTIYLSNDQDIIVITHHAPSYQSVIEKYKEDIVNPAFASELSEMILKYKIKYWIHGHMHSKLDYMIGETRVICNPRGYNDKENPDFNPKMELEI
jgi:predicted phosphohydrolase